MMILWSVQTEIDKNLLYILNTLPSKKFWTFKTCIKFIFLCKDSAVKIFRGKRGEKRGPMAVRQSPLAINIYQ